jgi:hypothetical protein
VLVSRTVAQRVPTVDNFLNLKCERKSDEQGVEFLKYFFLFEKENIY